METISNKAHPVVGLITYDPKAPISPDTARQIAKTISSYQLIPAKADNYTRQFQHVIDNVSVKDGYSRTDYEYYRPDERVPKKEKEIIAYCMDAYRKIGLIHNVIDLMADFATQGMDLVHPNPSIQKFYRGWWEKVSGRNRSERIASLLCRAGNVPLKRVMAKLSDKHEKVLRSLANNDKLPADTDFVKELVPSNRVIPIRYDILNPLIVEAAGGELAQFVGKQFYTISISSSLRLMVQSPKNEAERALVKELPDNIRRQIQSDSQSIVLPQDKLAILYYKKDDWRTWADPMIYAIYDDLIMLEKMKLADLAALDGAISQIRLWKLGDLEKGIFPTDAAINKLIEILMSNPGGGAFDLIWGPDLTVEEYKTNVHQFLGNAKYEPVLNNIYAGLGIPPTLTGSSNASGLTNNSISIRTLIKRLEYIRGVINDFWYKELELVRQAMGFRLSADIRYDKMILTDEAAEKKLLIDLADRLRISEETLRERLGESDELETLRLRREEEQRKKGKRTMVGGPYLTADKQYELAKVALQSNLITPQQSGLDIDEDYDDTPFNLQLKSAEKVKKAQQKALPKPKGQPGQGRPKNKKDSQKRKQRTPKIRTASNELENSSKMLAIMSWAKDTLTQINDVILPAYLAYYDKKDVRHLTSDQITVVENTKFRVLSKLSPFSTVGVANIRDILGGDLSINTTYLSLYNKFVSVMAKQRNRKLTIDELRNAEYASYAIYQLMSMENDS